MKNHYLFTRVYFSKYRFIKVQYEQGQNAFFSVIRGGEGEGMEETRVKRLFNG